jgi:predicted dinucleotide-binding enzyme
VKIGILGTGDVGNALAKGFLGIGYEVMIGTRDPQSEKAAAIKAALPGLQVGSFSEAAKFGDIGALCTLWSGTEQAIKQADPKNLAGKILIDVTNPLVFAPNAPPSLALGHTDSGGEQVQRWLTDSKVVKAFNIVGNSDMVNPKFEGGPPDMFIGGNDADAKIMVTEILTSFGWNTTDLGGIEAARLLEPLCILWVYYGMKTGGWRHAIKMLNKVA